MHLARPHTRWPRRHALAAIAPRASKALLVLAALAALALLPAGLDAAGTPQVASPHGKFRERCSLCHGASGWKPARISASFDHAKYGLVLAGAHAAANCMSCHQSLDFAQSKTQCASCHKDPHRGEMGTDCARCHGARSFTDRGPMLRAHQLTKFPLTGAHASIDCQNCHKSSAQGQLQFVGTQTECKSCHLAQYQSARTPDHAAAGYPLNCTQCHGTAAWTTAKFDHAKTGFALTGAHASLQCAGCHGDGSTRLTSAECQSCHLDKYNQDAARVIDHPKSGFAASACANCHGTTVWAGGKFDHNATSFPLSGAHSGTACIDCHKASATTPFRNTATNCLSCHQDKFNAAAPRHDTTNFPDTQCATCHTTTAWSGGKFDHTARTTYPLVGSHSTAATCAGCHSQNNYAYKATATDCASCHLTQYNATSNPNHQQAGYLASQCVTCHTSPTNWTSATFNHSGFPLTNGHAGVACAQCHSDNVFVGKSTACQGCHLDKFNAATPNHTLAAFAASACATCHKSTSAWSGTTYNHSTWPLTGAHAAGACNDCHGSDSAPFHNKPTNCLSCHQTQFNAATPPHNPTDFPDAQCSTCHGTTLWSGGKFDHTARTTYPLVASHSTVATCAGCHSLNNYAYKATATDCASCHLTQYNATSNPNHLQIGYAASACVTCHTSLTNWTSATFNHSGFPLTNAHSGLPCAQCHSDKVYAGKPTNCLSCHLTQFNAAAPRHDTTNFPDAQCATCHTTTAWAGGKFDHTARTTYPLVASHLTVATCAGCHSINNYAYKATATDCASCHLTQYNATSNPPHLQAGYQASQCVTCHTTPTNWTTATFDHSAFPLTGGHGGLQCAQCHSDNVYKGKATACQGCHMDKYNAATPNHVTQGFSASACASCHPVTVWSDGKFNHSPPTTTFALTGAHVSPPAPCSGCHADNVYKGKPTNCLSCHQTNFNASVPRHNLTDFPDAQCATCHTTTAWTGGKISNHGTYFPQTHHTNDCTDCHVNTANYMDNTCTTAPGCHTKSKINSSHNGRSGYTATAPDMQCVNSGCHRGGRGG